MSLYLTISANRVSSLRRVRGIVYCCQRIKEDSLFRGRIRYRLVMVCERMSSCRRNLRHRGFEPVCGNVSRNHLITLSDVATALCAVGERGLRMPCYDAPQGRGYSIYEMASSEFVGGTSSPTRTANKGRW